MDACESGLSEAEIWAKVIKSPMDEQGKLLILKRASIWHKCVHQVKKRLAESRFLKRRRSYKKVGKIISECPGTGKKKENFVRDCGAGQTHGDEQVY